MHAEGPRPHPQGRLMSHGSSWFCTVSLPHLNLWWPHPAPHKGQEPVLLASDFPSVPSPETPQEGASEAPALFLWPFQKVTSCFAGTQKGCFVCAALTEGCSPPACLGRTKTAPFVLPHFLQPESS